MLGAGHHVALHAAHQRRAHLAQQVRVLAVGLLRAAPGRVAQQVDADAAEEVAAQRPQFAADHVADALLQLEVPRRPACHRHGKCRRPLHHDPARPVAKADAGDPQPWGGAGRPDVRVVAAVKHIAQARPERRVGRHQVHLFVQRQLRKQFFRPGIDLLGAEACAGFERAKCGRCCAAGAAVWVTIWDSFFQISGNLLGYSVRPKGTYNGYR